MLLDKEKTDSRHSSERQQKIDDEYASHERRVGADEIVIRMLRPNPGGNNATACQFSKKGGPFSHEGKSEMRFFVKVCRFAELSITAGFLVARNALPALD